MLKYQSKELITYKGHPHKITKLHNHRIRPLNHNKQHKNAMLIYVKC